MFTETGVPDGAYVRRPAADGCRQQDGHGESGDQPRQGRRQVQWRQDQQGHAGGLPVLRRCYPHAGNNKAKADFAGNCGVSTASDAVYALPNNALESKSATSYRSPIVSGCKNYIIYISNGPAQDNSSDITQATTALAGLGGSTTTIPITPATRRTTSLTNGRAS